MSQENVEIVRKVEDHFNATGEPPWELFATDVVLDLTHATRVPDHLPRYVGEEGWNEFWSIWIEQFENLSFELLGLYDVGDDRVVLIHRQTAIAKASRVPVEQTNGFVYTLRDGLIIHVELYNGAADEALKAVGLEE